MLKTLSPLILGVFCTTAMAAPPGGEERELVNKVNASIDRGMQYLRQIHKPTTHWDSFWLNQLGDMQGGVTALSTLALLNCGASVTEREVAMAMDFLRRLEPKKTYVVGLTTMVFAEGRQPRDLPVIQRNVDWLIETAMRRGGKIIGWGYPFADESVRPDGSNTQYALLGLYAGKMAGAKIPDKVWKDIQDLYLTTQKKSGDNEGFWLYTEYPNEKASFTMTVAGVSGLLIANMGLNRSDQALNDATGVAAKCGQYPSNEPIARGLNWIGTRFAFENAPQSKSTFYNIYGIERVGRLSGQRFLGKVDWYRRGCIELVEKQNKQNGSWAGGKGVESIDGVDVISTSFALLFLSKGRTPVLISKLAYGDAFAPKDGALIERGEETGVIGWNRKQNDARHLTEFASKELFKGLPLGWQVYDPRRKEFQKNDDILSEVGVLVQSPILMFNGHQRIKMPSAHKELLKKYIEEGGFIVAEACCGSADFARSFRELMQELFPESALQPMPPEHAIWRSYFAVPPTQFPRLETLDRGCRTVVVFSPEPISGYWEEARFMEGKNAASVSRGGQAFRLGANVIAYATGMEPPQQRLTSRQIADTSKDDRSPPKGFIKPAQIQLPGEAPPAPAAMRNLMAHLQNAAKIDVVLDKESLPPGNEELFKYKFLYMHGRKRFDLSTEEITNLKACLQGGGLLFADACCGKPEFDQSFRAMAEKIFPNMKLEVIPPTDELYSAKLNKVAINSVKRREKADTAGEGYRDLPPMLEGIKIDGRWAIIYSKYDIGCALEGHKSSDCLGHTRESALQLATAAALYALKR